MARLGIGTLFSLILIMIAGVLTFQKLWSMSLDLTEARMNKLHIEKLYNDILDEVADWRQKYDDEVKKNQEQLQSLKQVSQELREKDKNVAALQNDRKLLQQRHEELIKEIAKLKEELSKKGSVEAIGNN